jgi:hypothetical protein
MTTHPIWCEPTRCGVDGKQAFRGLHRSAVVRGEFDRHSGNSLEVSLWAPIDGDPQIQIDFPGSASEGVDLTQSQSRGLADTILHLLAIAL